MDLFIPFLNKSADFAHGVDFGLCIVAPMALGIEEIQGYFRTENEEQIRLACYRMNYSLEELGICYHGKTHKKTGWLWMRMVKGKVPQAKEKQ